MVSFVKAGVDDIFREERHCVLLLLYPYRLLGCDCPISCIRRWDANEKTSGREHSWSEKDGKFRRFLSWVHHSIACLEENEPSRGSGYKQNNLNNNKNNSWHILSASCMPGTELSDLHESSYCILSSTPCKLQPFNFPAWSAVLLLPFCRRGKWVNNVGKEPYRIC